PSVTWRTKARHPEAASAASVAPTPMVSSSGWAATTRNRPARVPRRSSIAQGCGRGSPGTSGAAGLSPRSDERLTEDPLVVDLLGRGPIGRNVRLGGDLVTDPRVAHALVEPV